MNSLISVVVPVYNVELYIRQCVDSILAQTYPNLEIILVNDGSKDNCLAICEEYAKKDPRVRVIDKVNGGLSDARNVGIEAACGEYIGFVDSDDWIAPDMYEYLYRGIVEHDSDIALCEYYNVWKNDARATYRPAVRLFEGDACLRSLLQLKIGNYAWNKLYKRSLWEDGIRYPVGKMYEDVRTTYRIMQKAKKVAALPEPKYYYRRREGSITGKMTIANQGQCVESRMTRYDLIIQDWPDLKQFLLKEIYEYALLFRQSVCKSTRKEFDDQRELVETIADFLHRHEQDMYDRYKWGRVRRASYACMMEADYQSWRKSQRISLLADKKKAVVNRKTVKKIHSLKKRLVQKQLLSRYYGRHMRLPLDGNAAFVESRGGEDLAGNMFCIAEALCGRGMKVYLSVKSDYAGKVKSMVDRGSFDGLEIVEKGSAAYYRAFAVSTYLFNDMVYSDYMVKKPGQTWVNTWHGTPLKKLEFDVSNQRHALGGAAREWLRSDYLAVPSKYLSRKLLEASSMDQMYPGEILYSGYPRNSVFFDENCRAETRKAMGLEDKEVFAYMPTWRGTQADHQGTVGEYAVQNIFDFFERTLGKNQVVLVKLHNYAVDSVGYGGYRSVRPFPDDIDPYAVLNSADCLITDYSSVFFDYANRGGKVILFTYDREDYLKDRGVYLDLDDLPFPKADNYEALANELNSAKSYDDDDFRSTYCTYDGADATENLLRRVIDGENSCESETVRLDGKKNVLLYDATCRSRNAFPEGAVKELERLDTSQANYYYGIRQWAMKSTPKYLMNLNEGVRVFALSKKPETTLREALLMKVGRKRGLVPKTLIEREMNRQFGGDPFDEIVIIDDIGHDPFAPVLRKSPSFFGDESR
ncbi:CDP-glycerol glycerophosphotransferase family protein [Eggerthella lenta]|nr:CDP-glycerol glycerophosphotransferase family protein [Eggerthella lenta]